MEDITDRKKAEVLEQKYNVILDLTSNFIHEGMLVTKKGQVVFANKSIENIFGTGCQGISLFDLIERIVTEDRDQSEKCFRNTSGPAGKSLEITFDIDSGFGKINRLRGRFIGIHGVRRISCFLQLAISDESLPDLPLSTIHPEKWLCRKPPFPEVNN